MTEPRLHVAADLAEGVRVALTVGQAHYLASVLRRGPGDTVLLFNGRDGEWRARIAALSRRDGTVVPATPVRPQRDEPGPWLLAPVLRRETTEWLVEKACELGAGRILLTTSARSAVLRTNPDRLAAIAVEAAEQCGRLTVPAIEPPAPLSRRLGDWPAERAVVFGDETRTAPPFGEVLGRVPPGAALALLVGPEGGFDPGELDGLRKLPFCLAASLGPRILRAETAALAGLAVLQALAGDWRGPRADRPHA
ncbi:MAG: 16S rRNA (uracil(1498)-N(3))-methyltransferase [Acetobacteraceae bacterium]